MRCMHVGLNAHLLSGQTGYRTAGIHGYIDHLLRHLPGALPENWHLTALVGKDNPRRYDRITMRQASLDTESPLQRIVWEQLVQPWQLRDFDLYHALAFVAPLALTVPAVVTVYDLSFLYYPERLPAARRLYLRLFTGVTCRRARRVIAISESTARDVARTYGIPASKIDVAPCGHDPALFRPLPAEAVRAFRQSRGLPERFWLFIGTLEPRKNLPTLLEAYAGLPASDRLPLMVGGGKGWDYEPIFAAVERLGLGDLVHFIGFIPSEELPLWYNSAEAFVFPSVYEGFGLPVLEAMACGTPVVVSDASSLPEVVGEAGMCIPPHDVGAWREALGRAARDADWRASARIRGMARAAMFTWQHTAAETVACYRRALNN